MKHVEIFRGWGARAQLESAWMKEALDAQGIPCQGGPAQVVVAASDVARAEAAIAAVVRQARRAARASTPPLVKHAGQG
jgi:hypothetical protein